MDSARAAPANLASVGWTVTKLLRLRHAAAANAPVDDDGGVLHKLKLSRNLEDYSAVLSEPPGARRGGGEEEEGREAAMEALFANLFAGISAVKAAYAQLQVAQSPYDPDSIQSADRSVVSELKRLSELKHSYLKNHLPSPDPHPALTAQIEEQRNLLKTYQITTKKLESELQIKDSEVLSLQSKLQEIESQTRSLESKLHPGRSLAALDNLHLSGLNPTHFLTAVRYTVKSVRSFAKRLVKEMESAGWDLDSAAGAIEPSVIRRRRRRRTDHRPFAFEAFVCRKMFAEFDLRDFGMKSLERQLKWDRRRFFHEFGEARYMKTRQFLDRNSDSGEFCRAKYLGLVHPKMEAAFFGDLDGREAVSSGRGFPESEFFIGFGEMARRVWVLHCLFFSFGSEAEGAVFEARRGGRFSEVYMESVAEDGGDGDVGPTVGFTVVPGFSVGRTVIQCKVYLSSGGNAGGRS